MREIFDVHLHHRRKNHRTSEHPSSYLCEALQLTAERPGRAADVGELLPAAATAAHWLVDLDLQRRLPVCLRLGRICPDRTSVKHNDRSFEAGL